MQPSVNATASLPEPQKCTRRIALGMPPFSGSFSLVLVLRLFLRRDRKFKEYFHNPVKPIF